MLQVPLFVQVALLGHQLCERLSMPLLTRFPRATSNSSVAVHSGDDEDALDRNALGEVRERFVDHEQATSRVADHVHDLVRHQPRIGLRPAPRPPRAGRNAGSRAREYIDWRTTSQFEWDLEQLGRVRRQDATPVPPSRNPFSCSTIARRRTHSRSSAHVRRRSPSTTATRAGTQPRPARGTERRQPREMDSGWHPQLAYAP
jgi:hypothetical protein